MKTLIFIFLSLTLATFCQNKQQNFIVRKEIVVTIIDVGKSNYNSLKLENVTKVNKKYFTTAVYFSLKNENSKSSYVINDKVFNWNYFNKSIYPNLNKGKELNAKLYLSIYNDKNVKNKMTIIDSIKIHN